MSALAFGHVCLVLLTLLGVEGKSDDNNGRGRINLPDLVLHVTLGDFTFLS